MNHAHHNLIKNLVVEVRILRQKLAEAQDEAESNSWVAYRAEERATQARQDARRQADEAQRVQDEAKYRYWDQQDALKELEKARRFGNDWEEERALKKLRNL